MASNTVTAVQVFCGGGEYQCLNCMVQVSQAPAGKQMHLMKSKGGDYGVLPIGSYVFAGVNMWFKPIGGLIVYPC